tara:strand:+ start:3589 stop:6279 length:2691 start_codon:yes stop_codon:yes gene_type:complete
MSYQEKIYSQNGKCDRNFTGPVVNTSSDICVFNRPSFTMSGASSIDCPEITCSISGVPYNDLFTGTTECFETSALSGSCFNSIDWVTNVYEDDVLKYSNEIHSSTSLTGSVIDITTFSGSVVTAFNTLNYDYSFSGTEFTIDKEVRFENIKLELTTKLDYDANCPVTGNTTGFTSCSCPAGYTATTALDDCQKFTITASTFNGLGPTIGLLPNNKKLSDYARFGARFYEDATTRPKPLVKVNSSNALEDNSNSVLTYESVISNLWGDDDANKGRLNNAGLNMPQTGSTWYGFSKCVDIPSSGVYNIGIAADNQCRLRIDGELLLNLNASNTFSFNYWHVIPITLTSGKHIVEMEAMNDAGTDGAFGAEIYNATSEVLSGYTTEAQLSAVTIFTTTDFAGGYWNLGESGSSAGYYCPTGYSLNTCGGGLTECIKIENADITCVFTGACETKETVCDLDFSGITLNDSNVYVLTGETEAFDLTFDFTANTESFETANALFKYDIYKFIPELGYFNNTPVFTSDYYEWSSISGTSAFTTSVTANTINPDGEYLVKGHYIHDICTEFASKLNYKYSTILDTSGDSFGLYKPTRDFYFIAFSDADVPQLTPVDTGTNPIGALTVSSLMLDGSTSEFLLPFSPGDYIISLNGITLSPELDYSINVVDNGTFVTNTVLLSGATVSGDVLTYAYTNSELSNNIKSDTFDIDSPIISGATNAQGENKVYFNTDTNKYEIYLSMTPITNNDIAITLNGVSLAINIDYYQSITNPNRIIFEGYLAPNDILNAYYNTNTNAQGNQFGTSINVGWTIENPPSQVNGIFTLEISTNKNFTNIISSATTLYSIGVTSYSATANLLGNVGDKQYYRIKNDKDFTTLCNEKIKTSAFSEISNITIQTNVNNAY